MPIQKNTESKVKLASAGQEGVHLVELVLHVAQRGRHGDRAEPPEDLLPDLVPVSEPFEAPDRLPDLLDHGDRRGHCEDEEGDRSDGRGGRARRRLEEILHGARRLVVQAHVRADAVGEIPSGHRGEEDQVGEEPQQHDRGQQQRLVHEVDARQPVPHVACGAARATPSRLLRQAESARRRVFSNLTFCSASLTDSHSPACELQT